MLEKLGRGGMGAVFKARHLRLNRLVAINVLIGRGQADPEQLARHESGYLEIAARTDDVLALRRV